MDKKRCAIYTRKSVEEGLEQEFNSLDAQRSRCESYIDSQKHNGWICLSTHYDDGGWSGGNIERPAFKQLLSDIENGLIDIVIVYKLDRLSRSLLDFLEINQFFDKHNVGFVSVTQEINTSTSSGKMLLNLLMTFAQYEREAISERVRDKIAESRRMGKYSGGMVPYGYCRNEDTRRLDINLEEAKIVRWIFKNYLIMRSCSLVASTLNKRGKKTRSWISKHNIHRGGRKWNSSSIHNIITKPIYIGMVPHHQQMFPGEHEPIIPNDVWNKAQDIISTNRRYSGIRTKTREDVVFATLLRCGECNCALTPTYTDKNKKRYFYYVCQKTLKFPDYRCNLEKIPSKEIENIIHYQLSIIFQSYSLRQAILEEVDTQRSEVCHQLIKERSAMRQVLKYTKDNKQIQELEEKIDSLTSQHEAFKGKIRYNAIEHDLENFAPLWYVLKSHEKISFLDLLIEKIEVYPNKVVMVLNENFTVLQAEIVSYLRNSKSLSTLEVKQNKIFLISPISQKRINGQVHLELVGVRYDNNRRCLLHAIALAWQWNELLCTGKVNSIVELAKHVNYCTAYVSRILELAYLSPKIVESIVDGNVPNSLSLAKLHKGFPSDWDEQWKFLGFAKLKNANFERKV